MLPLERIRAFKKSKDDVKLETMLIELEVDYRALNAEAIYAELFTRYSNLYGEACRRWLKSKENRDFETLAKLLEKPS